MEERYNDECEEGQVITCSAELANDKLVKESIEKLVNLIDDFNLDVESTKDPNLRKCIIKELEGMKNIADLLKTKDKENEAIYALLESIYQTYTQYMDSKFDEPEFEDMYLKINANIESMLYKGKINFIRQSEFLNYVKNEVKIIKNNERLAKKSIKY